jgi:hypothetical protein
MKGEDMEEIVPVLISVFFMLVSPIILKIIFKKWDGEH